MEKLIEDLEKDLRDIIEGKQVETKRRELGDQINILILRMIIFSLQWASVGYQSALRFAGTKLGKKIGANCKKTELSLVLDEIKKIFEVLREGRVKIEIMPELKTAQLKIYESALTAKVPNVLQNLCFFEEGFIEGYIEGAISNSGFLAVVGGEKSINKVSVKEERCIGLGDSFCGFSISYE